MAVLGLLYPEPAWLAAQAAGLGLLLALAAALLARGAARRRPAPELSEISVGRLDSGLTPLPIPPRASAAAGSTATQNLAAAAPTPPELRAMMRRFFEALLLLAISIAATACAVCAAGDAPRSEEPAAAALRFRRVLAPADRIQDWPRGDFKYLPVEPAEFDRLLSAADGASAEAQQQSQARIATAAYSARLIGEATLCGEATLQVFHAGGGPRTLSLEPCNLALSKGRWTAADSAKPAAAPASIGMDNDGKLQAVVDRGGSLSMAWSLAGRRDADAASFAMELPPCPVCRFSLDLPLGTTPTVDRGMVLGSRPAGEEMRRWDIELGGHNRLRLRIASSDAVGRATRLAVARQSMVYDVSLRGVEISAQLKLEAYDEPLRQATLRLDPQVRLVNALCGDAPAPWSVESPPGSPMTRVVVTLPEPIRDGAGLLRLRALAPLATGEPWRLPRICPEGDVLAGRRRHALDRRAAGGGAADSDRLPANGGRSAADAS